MAVDQRIDVYLDGVTKATASVRIAHESILAATLKVAREKMQGVRTQAPAYPKKDYNENLTWQDLVEQGIVARKLVLNSAKNYSKVQFGLMTMPKRYLILMNHI